MKKQLQSSELVLNNNNRIYHLDLAPEDISEKIILVGDPGRVEMVSSHFDSIEVERKNREFVTRTGLYKGERFTVISTGIGPDNIDIVINELDALQSIDLETRELKEDFKPLTFVRIGTSGAMQEDIDVNDVVVARMALGLDNVPAFYANRDTINVAPAEMLFYEKAGWHKSLPNVYFVKGNEALINHIGEGFRKGITISAPGFYGPQGRRLRIPLNDENLNERIAKFTYNDLQVTNYEMESSALYALAGLMGHKAITLCKIIANRKTKDYNPDYKDEMNALIGQILERMHTIKHKSRS